MFIIDLDKINNNMLIDYNAFFYYNLLKEQKELEKSIIKTENLITNFINVIDINKDLFIITIIYVTIFLIVLFIPLLKKIKFNNIYFIISLTKIILLSRSFI